MHVLDDVDVWIKKIRDTDVTEVLSISDQDEWNTLSFKQRAERLANILENPIDAFSVVYIWYFRMKLIQAIDAIGAKAPVDLLEIGSGETDMIPQILSRKHNHADSLYVTANMNKKLTESLKKKTESLPIRIDVIKDAAQNICEYTGAEKFDVVAFEHSVNEVLQAMLGERDGIDTTNEDWFQVLPRMIKIISEEYQNNTLEASAKDEFLSLIRSCLYVLKPGGCIAITHFMYRYDLNLGYNPYLWENMLPIVRKWINTVEGGTEVEFEGFDHQWWLFYKKI